MQSEDTACLVLLEGELDYMMRADVAAKLPQPDACTRVVIDCSAVTFMDSTIVATILDFQQRFARFGGNPVNIILIASATIDRIFEVAHVKHLMTVVPAETPPQHA